jgi:hypothetical protein
LRGAFTQTTAISRIYIRRAGVIRVAEFFTYADTTAGSAENISVYVRLNDTTDYLIATVGTTGRERTFSNAAIDITVAAGDYVEIKWVSPTWATPPTSIRVGGYLLVE